MNAGVKNSYEVIIIWYMNKPGFVLENEMNNILWNTEM